MKYKMKKTPFDRFWAKVQKQESCWEWIGAIRGGGYGASSLNGKEISAHRLSYILFKGPIPEGLNICHTCDNRKCVNPMHLICETQSYNLKDCYSKKRRSPLFRKLNENQVDEIIYKKQNGKTYRELAKEYNVDSKCIFMIVKNKTYVRAA